MILELPFPDSILLPNRKEHWADKYPAVQAAKQIAWATAREEMMRIPGWKPISKCVIQYTFYPPDNRRRDPDNYVRAAKHYLDGMVIAGLLLDDSNKVLQNASGCFGPADRANPRTEVNIMEVS